MGVHKDILRQIFEFGVQGRGSSWRNKSVSYGVLSIFHFFPCTTKQLTQFSMDTDQVSHKFNSILTLFTWRVSDSTGKGSVPQTAYIYISVRARR